VTDDAFRSVYAFASPPALPSRQAAGSSLSHASRTLAGVAAVTCHAVLTRPSARVTSRRCNSRPGGAAIVHEAPVRASVKPVFATPAYMPLRSWDSACGHTIPSSIVCGLSLASVKACAEFAPQERTS
jgi:hypothetical protein